MKPFFTRMSAVSVPRSSSSTSSPFGVPLPRLLPLTPAQTGTWRTVTRSRRPLWACDCRRLRRKIHHDWQLHWLVRLVADAGVHGDESRSGGARGGSGGGGGGGGGSMRTARALCPTRGLQLLQMLLQQQQLLLRRRLRLRRLQLLHCPLARDGLERLIALPILRAQVLASPLAPVAASPFAAASSPALCRAALASAAGAPALSAARFMWARPTTTAAPC